MKRIIICGFIVIIMIIIGTASFYYTDSVTESSARTVDEISASFEDGDLGRARGLTLELDRKWRSFAQNDVFIVDKDHVGEITSSIARIKALAETQDDELLLECLMAKELILYYREKTGIAWKNIF